MMMCDNDDESVTHDNSQTTALYKMTQSINVYFVLHEATLITQSCHDITLKQCYHTTYSGFGTWSDVRRQYNYCTICHFLVSALDCSTVTACHALNSAAEMKLINSDSCWNVACKLFNGIKVQRYLVIDSSKLIVLNSDETVRITKNRLIDHVRQYYLTLQ